MLMQVKSDLELKKKKKRKKGSPGWEHTTSISLLTETTAKTSIWVYPFAQPYILHKLRETVKELHVAGFSVKEPLQPFYFGF